MKEVFLKSKDGYDLCLHLFTINNPKGFIQLIHGMEEHQSRYEPFIKFLNSIGYSCVSSDMRGHGKNAKDLGYFKDKKGYTHLIDDQLTITEYIKKEFNQEQIILFAHSMGTIITRNLLQIDSSSYKKVILSGYPNYNPGAGIGIILCNIIQAFKGSKYRSKLINKMSTGSFNKKIKNPKTEVDWISYNNENVDKYVNDPLCGFGFTVSAYRDLFTLVKRMHKPKLYKNVNKELEFLLLRGVDDPCVGGEKGSKDSIKVLLKAGFINIKDVPFANMRHEILNEEEYQKVYQEVEKFL
ncbi:MAG: alpha/beta fold hydrolase [Bacilli bacterium]